MLTAIPDQSLLDFEQRDVRRATDQAHEVGVMSFNAAGATIASARFGRYLSRRLELLDPANLACDADLEMPRGHVARQATG